MNKPPIDLEISRSIAVIRFCKPKERNPLAKRTLDVFEEILTRLKIKPDLNAIIVTGTDDVFLSGADIRELKNLDSQSAIEFSRRGQLLTNALGTLPQLTIAAINGYCMGGGLDVAMACDIRIASASSVFAHPGARLGIITGWGGTQRLPRIVGRARALELFCTARRWTSEEALKAGLITQIADPVLESAMALANRELVTSSGNAQFPSDNLQSFEQ